MALLYVFFEHAGPSLLDVFDNLAYVVADACSDVYGLASRIAATITLKQWARVPTPILYEVFPAYGAVFTAVRKALTACQLYLSLPGRRPPVRLGGLRCAVWSDAASIAEARARWDDVGDLLTQELRTSLEMPWAWEWAFRVGTAVSFDCLTSRRMALLEDLPLIMMDGWWHLRQLGDLLKPLGNCVAEIESARVQLEGTLSHHKLCQRITAALAQMYQLQLAFISYASNMDKLPKYAF
ncbi:hypothetical protein DFH09DRAFT_1370348 [Mycena vulgaris]|nr:hypothetical protein DFH09DRAFT_1370348 [Mycena vulgaris]